MQTLQASLKLEVVDPVPLQESGRLLLIFFIDISASPADRCRLTFDLSYLRFPSEQIGTRVCFPCNHITYLPTKSEAANLSCC